MAAPRSEALVEQRIMKLLRGTPRVTAIKAGRDGWPDRILCYRGVFIGLEIKSERQGHTTTARQTQRLAQIGRAGGLVGVVRSTEDVLQLLAAVDAHLDAHGGFPWYSPPNA